MSKKKYRSDFLFPKSGFLIGMGSVLNVGGNYFRFNYSESDIAADTNAIENDWGVIGQDLLDTAHAINESPALIKA